MATVKLKDWTSEPCSDVCGTNLTGHRHEAQVSLTRLPQHTKHREGVCTEGGQRVGRKLATGAVLPLVCSSMQARCVQAAQLRPCQRSPPVLAACGTSSCRCAAGSSAAAGLAGSPPPSLQEQDRFPTAGWLAEPMSVPASLYRCPHHSAGEGRVNWRYQLCCWGMQFPGSFCTHQGISACSFNEETISRDSSSKPNLASSPCRYELNQLCCHATI